MFPKKTDEQARDKAVSSVPKKPKPAMSSYLAGEEKNFVKNLSSYLPHELVGGSVPYVSGTEEEAVWNAASQACGTEKVHFTYTVEDKYETVYIYEQEGLASALRWDPETGRMQVFLGAGRTLLPRIQSMDANFVTIDAERADVNAWKNRMLKTEQLSRATSRILLLSGILLNFIILAFVIMQFFYTNTTTRQLDKVKADTERASQNLLIEAYNALQSDSIKHMVRIQELLDELKTIDGTLVKYEVNGGRLNWDALIPPAYGQGVGTIRGKVQPGIEADGRVRLKGTR